MSEWLVKPRLYPLAQREAKNPSGYQMSVFDINIYFSYRIFERGTDWADGAVVESFFGVADYLSTSLDKIDNDNKSVIAPVIRRKDTIFLNYSGGRKFEADLGRMINERNSTMASKKRGARGARGSGLRQINIFVRSGEGGGTLYRIVKSKVPLIASNVNVSDAEMDNMNWLVDFCNGKLGMDIQGRVGCRTDERVAALIVRALCDDQTVFKSMDNYEAKQEFKAWRAYTAAVAMLLGVDGGGWPDWPGNIWMKWYGMGNKDYLAMLDHTPMSWILRAQWQLRLLGVDNIPNDPKVTIIEEDGVVSVLKGDVPGIDVEALGRASGVRWVIGEPDEVIGGPDDDSDDDSDALVYNEAAKEHWQQVRDGEEPAPAEEGAAVVADVPSATATATATAAPAPAPAPAPVDTNTPPHVDTENTSAHVDTKTPAQEAADQKAADQKAAEQKARTPPHVDTENTSAHVDTKTPAQEAADQKAADQKAADQKAADQKAADQKAAEQKARTPPHVDTENTSAHVDTTKTPAQKAAEQKAAEQRAKELYALARKEYASIYARPASGNDRNATCEFIDSEILVPTSNDTSNDEPSCLSYDGQKHEAQLHQASQSQDEEDISVATIHPYEHGYPKVGNQSKSQVQDLPSEAGGQTYSLIQYGDLWIGCYSISAVSLCRSLQSLFVAPKTDGRECIMCRAKTIFSSSDQKYHLEQRCHTAAAQGRDIEIPREQRSSLSGDLYPFIPNREVTILQNTVGKEDCTWPQDALNPFCELVQYVARSTMMRESMKDADNAVKAGSTWKTQDIFGFMKSRRNQLAKGPDQPDSWARSYLQPFTELSPLPHLSIIKPMHRLPPALQGKKRKSDGSLVDDTLATHLDKIRGVEEAYYLTQAFTQADHGHDGKSDSKSAASKSEAC